LRTDESVFAPFAIFVFRTKSDSGGGSGLLGFVDQATSGVGSDRTLAQPVFGTSDIEDEGLALRLRRVCAEELDRGTITAGTGLSHDYVVDGFVDGADARETDFESHVKWFSGRLRVWKSRGMHRPAEALSRADMAFVAGLTGFTSGVNVRALCSKQASSASPT
jgi:hypothetical protein